MQNNFDLKKFLVENKLTLQSQTMSEEEEEFNVDAPKEWGNIKYLTVGDTVKSEYWDPSKDDTMWFGTEPHKHPDYVISYVAYGKFPWDNNEITVVLKSTNGGKGSISGNLDGIGGINNMLFPQYKIVLPDSPELKYK